MITNIVNNTDFFPLKEKLISCTNINIANMINSSKGDYAYTMIDVDAIDEGLYADFEQKCLDIDAIIRVRGLKKTVND